MCTLLQQIQQRVLKTSILKNIVHIVFKIISINMSHHSNIISVDHIILFTYTFLKYIFIMNDRLTFFDREQIVKFTQKTWPLVPINFCVWNIYVHKFIG